jgi:hypothetical protein
MLDSAYLAAMAECKPRACGRESCRELLGKQSQTLEQSEPTVPCLQRTVVVVVVMVPRPTYVDGLDTRDLPTAKRGYIILVGSNERGGFICSTNKGANNVLEQEHDSYNPSRYNSQGLVQGKQ